MSLLRSYLRISLVTRIIVGFLAGAAIGGLLWYVSVAFGMKDSVQQAMRYASPFGTVFISMLKMIVVPIVFFSLVGGAASLPLQKLGKVGGKVIGWYFATMAFAAVLGITLAKLVNPGSGASLEGWKELVKQFGSQAQSVAASAAPKSLRPASPVINATASSATRRVRWDLAYYLTYVNRARLLTLRRSSQWFMTASSQRMAWPASNQF